MNAPTLAEVFGGADLKSATGQLFSLAEVEQAATLAAADTVDSARGLVGALVARASHQLLDISLADVLLGAWTKMAAVREFAAGEAGHSAKVHKLELAEHRVVSEHAPKVELIVHDTKVAEVTVAIALTLILARTTLLIKQGRIVKIEVSGCQATGTLSCHGQKLLERELGEFRLPAIDLGEGVEIPPFLRVREGDGSQAP